MTSFIIFLNILFAGTLGTDIAAMVTKFRNGLDYNALRDENFRHFGWVDTVIGQVSLQENWNCSFFNNGNFWYKTWDIMIVINQEYFVNKTNTIINIKQ